MSAVCGDLFYLPLYSALSASDIRTIAAPTEPISHKSKLNNGFWKQFIGDQANSSLKCLADPADIHPSFWPLVLYGDSGNGKTSIATAFANRLADDLGLEPMFVRAADVVRRYRDAIQTDSVADFRRRFMTSQVLIMDDLHVLKNKQAVQKEIAKLLDGLTSRQKPVIVTINCMPNHADWLIPQLASRLQSGLVLPVNRPGVAARNAIVTQLAQRFSLKLADTAIQFIVDHCDFSVPRLTQLFAQLKHSLIEHEPGNPLDASHIKMALFGDRAHFDQDIQLITRSVADSFGLTTKEICSKSRKQTTVLARGVSIFLCRDVLQLSFAKIGRCFGGRDHSTIIHAHKNIVNSMSEDTALTNTVAELRRKLTDQFLLVVRP